MPCCSPHQKREEDDHKHSHSSSSCCQREAKQEKPSQSSCCSAPQSNKKTKIDRQMTIEEILGMFPYKAQRLSQEITNAGLHCVGCHAAVWETLEAGMYTHGKTDPEIDELVRRLNLLLEEKIDTTSVRLTPRAAAKYLEILSLENKQGWGMRFAEEMAGCNGYEFILDFSKAADPDDLTFVSHGIEIHVKKKLSHLVGSEIDYVEGLRGSGFKISCPSVRTACGCGSSHNY